MTDLRGWEPHGVIRAEEDYVDTPAADQIPAFVRAQPIEGGGCIHEDVLEAGEQAEGILPDAPAAQMGADELQAGKRAEDGKNPVWIGIVEAVIPGMYQHRKAGILAELIDGHGLGRVSLKTLDIRMELDAIQAQGEQFAEILLQVIGSGVQGSQAREGSLRTGGFGGNETIDAGDLMGRGGDGVNQEMGNARLAAQAEEGSRGAITMVEGEAAIKAVDAFHRPTGDGFRIDVAVGVKDPVRGASVLSG